MTNQQALAPTSLENEEVKHLAALDIGSNSFHFVHARLVKNNLQILHREKYRIKLASGLDENDMLSDEAMARGIAALSNLLSTTESLSDDNFRVVATYTLRQAKNAKKFLRKAREVFPFDIEIISGHEEARLIYQGVAHNSDAQKRQLVIDIGGGSTECIIGEQFNVKALVSLNIGCVSFQQRYFANGEITNKQFNKAIIAAKFEIEAIVKRFRKKGWQAAIGTSGTIKSIHNIINADENIHRPITLAALLSLKKTLIKTEKIEDIKIEGLKESRREVICSGLAILIALFEMLDIEEMQFCAESLREGVLYQQLDMLRFQDIRQRTIDSLCERFAVDQNQAASVEELAQSLLKDTKKTIKFPASIYERLLVWATQVHELGVDINPSGHHKHGEYILNEADLSGFNQEQQQALSWLVGNQRKKMLSPEHYDWYLLEPEHLMIIASVLRLAILLNQQRQLNEMPPVSLEITKHELVLHCQRQWLLDRPMVNASLFNEQSLLKKVDVHLKIVTLAN